MATKKDPIQAPAPAQDLRPAAGGMYVRDPDTGELTRMDTAPTEPPAAPDKEN